MSPDLNVFGLSYVHILDFGHFALIFLAFWWFGDGTVLTMQLRVTGAVYNISRRTEEVVDRQAVDGNDGESTVFHGNETLNSRQRFKLNERASGHNQESRNQESTSFRCMHIIQAVLSSVF
jgi:hypothetical protein